jgi:TRAP transporter TAXI family solute receptor
MSVLAGKVQTFARCVIGILALAAGISGAAAQEANTKYHEEKRQANASTVTIISSSTSSTFTKLIEDIQNVLDDPKTNELRILPVLGRGASQNVHDILFLKGIDMGVVDSGFLQAYKEKDPVLYGNIEQRVQYVAKLLNSELHLLAPKSVQSYEDLRGKKVNLWKPASVTAAVTAAVFKLLEIEIQPVYLDTDAAFEALKSGEIAAMARMGGAPQADYDKITEADGWHFVPLSETTLSPGKFGRLMGAYLPAQLRHDHYPKLIGENESVSTVASGIMLAVYNWPEGSERYQKLEAFTRKFFDNIDKFRDDSRHPKWKEINLAAEVPGWVRFKPAQAWLDAQKVGVASGQPEMRVAFEKFLSEYSSKTNSGVLTNAQRDAFYNQFVKWWQQQNPPQRIR